MNDLRKLVLSLLLFAQGAVYTIAQEVPVPGEPEEEGIGGAPVDQYTILLILTALTVIGFLYFRQRQLNKA